MHAESEPAKVASRYVGQRIERLEADALLLDRGSYDDVESGLPLHPAVDEVAVAGPKEQHGGQHVIAFAKFRGDVSGPALDEHLRRSPLVNFEPAPMRHALPPIPPA